MTRTALIFLTLISIYGCNDKELTIDEVYLNLEKNTSGYNLVFDFHLSDFHTLPDFLHT